MGVVGFGCSPRAQGMGEKDNRRTFHFDRKFSINEASDKNSGSPKEQGVHHTASKPTKSIVKNKIKQ